MSETPMKRMESESLPAVNVWFEQSHVVIPGLGLKHVLGCIRVFGCLYV